MSTNGSPFHHHAIREGARVALIRIADDVFLVGAGAQHRLPLDAGGERRTATATQPGSGDGSDDRRRLHVQRIPQTPVAAVPDVVLEAARIGQADARERQALLVLEVGNLLRQAVTEGVRRAAEEAGVEEPGHVPGLHRTVGDPTGRCRDLDQRFQPQQPARAVAHHFDIQAASRTLGEQRPGGRIRAHTAGCCIARHVNARPHGLPAAAARVACISSSKRCAETRPCSS